VANILSLGLQKLESFACELLVDFFCRLHDSV